MKQSVVNDKQIVDIHIQTGIILRMIFFTVIQQKIRFSYSTFGMSCFCLREGTRTIQCGSPVDCRQTPAGRRLLYNVPSPFWRTARMHRFPGTSVGSGQGSCRKNVRVYKQIVPNMCFFILYSILFCGIVKQSLNKITVAERRWSGESEECAERDSR